MLLTISLKEFNPDFIRRMINRIEWTALRKIIISISGVNIFLDQAMEMVGQAGKLPEVAPTEDENDEDLLKKVHHALVEIEVVQGHLECPESGRQFPITNGIPNMLLNENEV